MHLMQTQRDWDAWVFTETWRPEQNEVIDFEAEAESDEELVHKEHEPDNSDDQLATEDGEDGIHKVREPTRRARHCLFACGGQKARGVAIVINARHAKHAEMDAVNENVCAVNLRINGQRTCIIAVYMPHAGKCSEEHESVYTELSRIIKNAKRDTIKPPEILTQRSSHKSRRSRPAYVPPRGKVISSRLSALKRYAHQSIRDRAFLE